MTLLERLKELSATTGRRNGNEDLGHWADREKHENAWVRDVALPALIAVAEAAQELSDECREVNQYGPTAKYYADIRRLDAALAKLEGEAPYED